MGDSNTRQHPTGKGERVEIAASQACPECGGVMKSHRMGRLIEFQYHVGHRFGLKTMIAEKSGVVEKAMWTALSQSQELVGLLEEATPSVDPGTSEALQQEIVQRRQEQEVLRRIIDRTRTPALNT